MKNIISCAPIIIGQCDRINHLAFDGCAYYCTAEYKNEIFKLDAALNLQKTYTTRREYNCICYDYTDHCFWVSIKHCPNMIFKLDCNMNEIDCFRVCASGRNQAITGISYNCCRDTLIISFPCMAVEFEKERGRSIVIHTPKGGTITDVLSLCPYILITVVRNSKQYVEIWSRGFERVMRFSIEDKHGLKNLIFNPCDRCGPGKIECLVYIKGCYINLCTWAFCNEIKIKPCPCNNKVCDECCPDDPPYQDACADVLESIALIEAALSHILNAEGEKLQKALDHTDDIDKILYVNREINKTITNVTHLEHVLYAKLAALTESGLNCCEPCP